MANTTEKGLFTRAGDYVANEASYTIGRVRLIILGGGLLAATFIGSYSISSRLYRSGSPGPSLPCAIPMEGQMPRPEGVNQTEDLPLCNEKPLSVATINLDLEPAEIPPLRNR